MLQCTKCHALAHVVHARTNIHEYTNGHTNIPQIHTGTHKIYNTKLCAVWLVLSAECRGGVVLSVVSLVAVLCA